MMRLADAGRTVLLETNWLGRRAAIDPRVRVILDIKTPGSRWKSTPISGPTSTGSGPAMRSNTSSAIGPTSIGPPPRSYARTSARVPGFCSLAFGQVNATGSGRMDLETRLPVRLQLNSTRFSGIRPPRAFPSACPGPR